MAGPFYAAWVGGIAYPAFSLNTFGDVWGGELNTFGNTWGGALITQGDVAEDSNVIDNLDNVNLGTLIIGNTYFVTGPGIPANEDGTPSTTFTFTGGTSVTISTDATATQAGASLRITNTSQVTVVSNIAVTAQLVIGQVYDVSGGGIQPGTTTTYGGGNSVTLSQPAISTNYLTRLTFSTSTGQDIIKNLQSTAGLVNGNTYAIWGPGVPSGSFFTYAGGTSITLTTQATVTNVGVYLAISAGIQEDDGGSFDSSTMLVEDLDIFGMVLTHSENNFPMLDLVVQNPGMGLISDSSKLWLWLSWDPDFENSPSYTPTPGNIIPLFHGRIVGVPQNLTDEVVTLKFVATATDFYPQKQTIAASLQVLPYYDVIWLQKRLADPDTALEGYTYAWHFDRLTLDVSTSDILNAEDGTITIEEGDHFYEELEVTYREAPLAGVNISGTVSWTQAGSGTVDLTESLVTAFQAAGSPYPWPLVGSYTSSGLLSSWPRAGAGIGGGWLMANDATAVDASVWVPQNYYNINYTAGGGNISTSTLPPAAVQALGSGSGLLPPIGGAGSPPNPFTGSNLSPYGNPNVGFLQFFSGYSNWAVTLTLSPISTTFTVQFDAARRRSEVITATVNAGVQSMITNPNTSNVELIELNSSFVDQSVDPGGALPIGDVRRNTYFTLARGQQSLQYLLLLARAKLVSRSRAVEITFKCAWKPASGANITGLSCRQAVQISNRYLPGGTALGKVTAYKLTASGDGAKDSMVAEVTIGCAVGLGNTLPTAAAGTNAYATSYADDYTQTVPGTQQIDVIVGTLQYQALDGTYIIDDDGVDLFNMVPSTVIQSLTISNGPTAQAATAAQGATDFGDPIGNLKAAPTIVDLQLVPVTGGDFMTQIPVQVSPLSIPEMINLAAPPL